MANIIRFGNDTNTIPIVKDGLVLFLDGKSFKNSPPTTEWLDASGQDNNGTPSGFAYTPSSGSDGDGGVKFDGVNDYVHSVLNPIATTDLTITIKMKFPQLPTKLIYMFNLNPSGTQGSLPVLFWSTANLTVGYYEGNSKYIDYNFEASQEYNIVVVRTATLFKFYIDGIRVNSVAMANGEITINDAFLSKGNYANIVVYDFLIHTKELTATEIQQNYLALGGTI